MSIRQVVVGKSVLKFFSFCIAVMLTAFALWATYVYPWLDWTSPLDGWLQRHTCLVHALCTPNFSVPYQPGIVAALLAVPLFAYALHDVRLNWPKRVSQDFVWPTPGTWQTRLIIGGIALGVLATLAQAYLVLSSRTPPVWLWVLGMAAFGLAALLWDSFRPQELRATAAYLGIAIGMGLLVVGLGTLMAGKLVTLLLFLMGGTLLGLGVWATTRLGFRFSPLEHIAMLGLAWFSLVLFMSRAWSWRFAFWGDEWGFYEAARALNHQPGVLKLLGLRAPNDYHSVLSSAFQAWVMRLAGETIFGWRLSSVLPVTLSIPPLYVVLRWLTGRRSAALLGAGLFASAHMLLTFSMIPYNNTQALLPLSIGLGFLVFAFQGSSILRYFLTGMALGFGLFAFGLARLAFLPIGIYLLAYLPLNRRTLAAWSALFFGFLSSSAPMLFLLRNWRTMLKATPVESEVASRGIPVPLQMAHNAIYGLLAPLGGGARTHYVAGPHLEPLTFAFALVGLSLVLLHLRCSLGARVWFLAGGAFVLAVSAIQQYGFVSNTRMFILPFVYAVFAGIGGLALGQRLFPKDVAARGTWVGMLVMLAAVSNWHHVDAISLTNTPVSREALLMREILRLGAADGGGMPVFVVLERGLGPRESQIARAYNVGRERLVFLTAQEAFELKQLCEAGQRAAMALISVRNPQVNDLRAYLRSCWQNSREDVVRNNQQEPVYYRFLTQKRADELRLRPKARPSSRQRPDTLFVTRPWDMVVDGHGTLFVLSREEKRVYRFSQDGHLEDRFPLVQDDPSAMALTVDGLLLVGSSGGKSRLVWYDGDGTVIRFTPPELDVGVPRGLAVTGKGEILIADVAHSRVIRMTPNGDVIGELAEQAGIRHAGSVAPGKDNTVWVLNPDGELLHLSWKGQILHKMSVPPASPEHSWRFLVTSNGDIVMAEPERQRVVRRTPEGRLIFVWGGLQRPFTLVLDTRGRLLVAEPSLDEVAVFPPLKDTGSISRAVVRDDVEPGQIGFMKK